MKIAFIIISYNISFIHFLLGYFCLIVYWAIWGGGFPPPPPPPSADTSAKNAIFFYVLPKLIRGKYTYFLPTGDKICICPLFVIFSPKKMSFGHINAPPPVGGSNRNIYTSVYWT